jgi:hypothetical protein
VAALRADAPHATDALAVARDAGNAVVPLRVQVAWWEALGMPQLARAVELLPQARRKGPSAWQLDRDVFEGGGWHTTVCGEDDSGEQNGRHGAIAVRHKHRNSSGGRW